MYTKLWPFRSWLFTAYPKGFAQWFLCSVVAPSQLLTAPSLFQPPHWSWRARHPVWTVSQRWKTWKTLTLALLQMTTARMSMVLNSQCKWYKPNLLTASFYSTSSLVAHVAACCEPDDPSCVVQVRDGDLHKAFRFACNVRRSALDGQIVPAEVFASDYKLCMRPPCSKIFD